MKGDTSVGVTGGKTSDIFGTFWGLSDINVLVGTTGSKSLREVSLIVGQRRESVLVDWICIFAVPKAKDHRNGNAKETMRKEKESGGRKKDQKRVVVKSV